MATGGSGGGSSGAIRAGRAFVELFAEDSRLARTLSSWKARTLGFASFISKLGAGMIGGGAALLAPLVAIFTSTVDHLDRLDEAADRLGTTPEVFDAISKQASFAGIAVEDLEHSFSKMQANLSDAAAGGMETAAAFQAIGLNAHTLMGLPLEEQIGAIADGINKLGNAANRTNIARSIFGKSGANLLPFLKDGGAGIKSGMDDFRNPALNEAAKNAGRINDALDKAKIAGKSVITSLVAGFIELVGPIEAAAEKLTGFAKSARQFIRENSSIIVTAAAVAAGLIALGAGFVTVGGTLAVITIAAGGFVSALVAIKTVILAVVSPIGLVAVAVAALAAGIVYLWSTTADGRGAIAQMRSGLGELVGTATSAMQGIKDAFAGGDLALAGQIAFTALKLEFTKVLGFWMDRWNAFKGFFVDGWHDGIMLVKLAWSDLSNWFSKLFLNIFKSLNDNFGKSIKSMLNGIADAIEKADVLGLFKDEVKELRNLGGAFGSGAFSTALDEESKKADKEHAKKRNRIIKDAEAAKDARKSARDADKNVWEEKIRGLEKELELLNAAAAEAAAEAAWQKVIDEAFRDTGGVTAGVESMRAFGGAAKGGFGGPLAAQFGVGDNIAGKQLDALHDIRDGVNDLGKKLEAK